MREEFIKPRSGRFSSRRRFPPKRESTAEQLQRGNWDVLNAGGKQASEAIVYGDDAQLRSLRANAYLAENRCPEATTDAHAALMMEPIYEVGYHSDADANAVLGVCSYQDGDLLNAEQYLTEALAIMYGTEYQVEVTQYWTQLLTKIRQEPGR